MGYCGHIQLALVELAFTEHELLAPSDAASTINIAEVDSKEGADDDDSIR